MIELGIPFSEPMADGPVIQAACERALAHQVNLTQVLQWVEQFRCHNSYTPIILMGYLNPIECCGYQAFSDAAAIAGVDAVLIVDLPPEESGELKRSLQEKNIDLVFLLAPTTRPERIELIAKEASGFVYYVALKGVTGASHISPDDLVPQLAAIRQKSSLPIGVGFGVKDAQSAREVAKLADAVVVGSSIVERIAQYANQPETLLNEVSAFVSVLRKNMMLELS